MTKNAERVAIFTRKFREDLAYWIENDRKLAIRTLDLVEAIMREPLSGIGKPEPLKFILSGCWSRRITHADRLVYQVTADRVIFLQARLHYE